LYYLFDSIIIPLIKSCFRVTESSADKNKLFYFRLDVWHEISEPAFNKIKLESFEEMSPETAKSRLSGRPLTYSHVRLLPKSNGFRSITNLKRKPVVKMNGKRVLGLGINSLLAPAYNILRFEKVS
jgi:telomerase reverse transcriptase